MEAEAFAALGDPTRLAIVEALGNRERSVGEVVARFDLSQPAISQHLKVLREAGLVGMRPEAQRRMYRVSPGGFRVIELWLERHRRRWAKRLDALEAFMDEGEGEDG